MTAISVRPFREVQRPLSDGVVASYIHHNGKLGVLIEVNCETDVAARTDVFRTLVLPRRRAHGPGVRRFARFHMGIA